MILFASQYNQFIAFPDNNTHVMAVNCYTGSLVLLPVRISNALDDFAATGKPLEAEAFSEKTRNSLIDQGFLTKLPPSIERQLVLKHSQIIQHELHQKSFTIEIIPSYDCQLACKYCFEKQARTQLSQNRLFHKVMNTETVNAVFNAIDKLLDGKKKRRIGIFGGEPLTKKTKACIEYLVQQGGVKGYNFLVTTNGIDLQQFLHLLNPKALSCVRFTISGVASSHDLLRHYPNGKPTYDRVLSNLKRALERDVEIQVRIDVTRSVLLQLEAFAEELIKIGFDRHPNAFCFCVAVHPTRATVNDLFLRDEFVKEADIVNYLIEHPSLDNLFRPSQLLSPRIESLFKDNFYYSLSGLHCDAVTGIYIFDPNGDIYPCNKVVGHKDQRIGTFMPKIELSPSRFLPWQSYAFSQLSGGACSKCTFSLICGGGCRYLRFIDNTTSPNELCADYKRFFESIIQYYYRRQLREKTF